MMRLTVLPPQKRLFYLEFYPSYPHFLSILILLFNVPGKPKCDLGTLFAYLPPPQDLFEESLQRGSLKTAGGYLLILHTFEELSSSSEQLVRLLARAKDEGDWELCKELARFLTALDETGDTLREALEMVNLRSPQDERGHTSFMFENTKLKVPLGNRIRSGTGNGRDSGSDHDDGRSSSGRGSPPSPGTTGRGDYFSNGLARR